MLDVPASKFLRYIHINRVGKCKRNFITKSTNSIEMIYFKQPLLLIPTLKDIADILPNFHGNYSLKVNQ